LKELVNEMVGSTQDTADVLTLDAVADSPKFVLHELGLPVREAAVIQSGGGSPHYDLNIAAVGNIGLCRARHYTPSIGVTVLRPEQTGFVIPNHSHGESRVNGEHTAPGTTHTPDDLDSAYVSGAARQSFGIVLPKQQFIDTVAALRGINHEDEGLEERLFRISPATERELLSRITGLLERPDDGKRAVGPIEFSNTVFALMTDAYLETHSERRAGHRQGQSPARIVRRAEERFLAAQGGTVSLADLCAAAGVGRSRLYQACQTVCGVAPLAYFRKRQLTRARSQLLDAEPSRGLVKRIALDIGMNALGRFSREYRELFGELPSATLNRPPT
jgi:AraC-like DNA-binding protein